MEIERIESGGGGGYGGNYSVKIDDVSEKDIVELIEFIRKNREEYNKKLREKALKETEKGGN